jgi:transcriptional regulator with XRE-family HTH domain
VWRAAKLSRYGLAKAAGLSGQGAVNLEAPGADPRLSTMLRLAAALGVPPAELIPTPNS